MAKQREKNKGEQAWFCKSPCHNSIQWKLVDTGRKNSCNRKQRVRNRSGSRKWQKRTTDLLLFEFAKRMDLSLTKCCICWSWQQRVQDNKMAFRSKEATRQKEKSGEKSVALTAESIIGEKGFLWFLFAWLSSVSFFSFCYPKDPVCLVSCFRFALIFQIFLCGSRIISFMRKESWK